MQPAPSTPFSRSETASMFDTTHPNDTDGHPSPHSMSTLLPCRFVEVVVREEAVDPDDDVRWREPESGGGAMEGFGCCEATRDRRCGRRRTHGRR